MTEGSGSPASVPGPRGEGPAYARRRTTWATIRALGAGILGALAAFAPAAGAAQAAAETAEEAPPAAFVAGFEDLPLMPGLHQSERSGMVFDTPAGRIVESVADGLVPPDEVAAFYARTLPQLGWVRVAENKYRREGEVLVLEIAGAGRNKATAVRFFLSPD